MAAPTPMKQLAMNFAMCVLLLSVSSSSGRDWSVRMNGPPLCGACTGMSSASPSMVRSVLLTKPSQVPCKELDPTNELSSNATRNRIGQQPSCTFQWTRHQLEHYEWTIALWPKSRHIL